MSLVLPKTAKESVDICAGCPKLCRHSCPVAEALKIEAYTPTAKQTMIKMLADGRLPLSVDALSVAYYCTLCGSHTDHCKPQIDGRESIMQARFTAYESGLIPPRLRAALRKYSETGSLFDPGSGRIDAPFSSCAEVSVLVDPLDKDDVFAAEQYLRLFADLDERIGVIEAPGLGSGQLLFELGLRDESKKLHDRITKETENEGLKLVTNPRALLWLLEDDVYKLMTRDDIPRDKPNTMKLKGHRSPYLAAADYLMNVIRYSFAATDTSRVVFLESPMKSEVGSKRSEVEITPRLSSYIFGGALSIVDPSAEDAMAKKLLDDARYFGIDTVVTSSVPALRKLALNGKPRTKFITDFLNHRDR